MPTYGHEPLEAKKPSPVLRLNALRDGGWRRVRLRREELYRLLGDLPPRERPVTASLRGRDANRDYIVEDWELDLNGLEPVPAYFVKPKGVEGRLPVVLYQHAHGGDYQLGRRELLQGHGRYLQSPPYAQVLTELGYAALCIDAWTFGERHHSSEGVAFKQMLLNGQVLWGMMVYDSLKAADYLLSRDDVDPDRLAVFGLSTGGGLAWWTAALDRRLQVCIDICFLVDYHTLVKASRLGGVGFHFIVPNLLKHCSAAEINALIAPRPHLSLVGTRDKLTPPSGLAEIDHQLQQVYRELGAEEAWQLCRYDSGHQETVEGRSAVLRWLQRWL